MNNVILSNINTLELDSSIEIKLIENGINTIGEIWVMNKNQIRNIGFSDKEIKQMQIKLQLSGLDFNKKKYK